MSPAEPVLLAETGPQYVSRGGDKLAPALEHFGIDVKGARALDAGASTGGFTDCLLQKGASSVVALDVGRGQLHETLRDDPRVTVLERTDVRRVSPASLGGRFDVVTADLSFISLRTVAAPLAELARPGGALIVLVKPQFEVGRREAAKGKGVVRDPHLWRQSVAEVIAAFDRAGATMMGVMVSPLRGADGNAEFLLHLTVGSQASEPDTHREQLIDSAVAAAESGREARS